MEIKNEIENLDLKDKNEDSEMGYKSDLEENLEKDAIISEDDWDPKGLEEESIDLSEKALGEEPTASEDDLNKAEEDSDQKEITTEDVTLNEEEYQWYVVSTIKNSETAIYKSLLEFAKNSPEDILEVYMPEEVIKKYKDNKEIIQTQPIMNYLYVKCRIGFIQTKEFKIKINKKYQVIGTISEEELLKSRIENEKLMSSRSLEFYPGMKVKIISGNYNGFSGQVNSITDDYIVLTILILNFPTMIEVHKSDLIPGDEE